MYIKNPNTRRDIHVPENYGGNAFKNNIYTDIVPPADDIPNSDITDIADNAPISPPLTDVPTTVSHSQKLSPQLPVNLSDSSQVFSTQESPRSAQGSIFSSLLPSVTSSHHFPFGHGIGSEELFILGMMLLIYMSPNDTGEVDSELLLLLCILLFSG